MYAAFAFEALDTPRPCCRPSTLWPAARQSYKYNVCFFKSVTQDSTSLGQWSGEWRGSDYTAQAYTNGASCWQNPAR